jgi:hypothetical protein
MDFYFKYSTFHVPSPISGGEPENPFATTRKLKKKERSENT